jgi:hypothetical protein
MVYLKFISIFFSTVLISKICFAEVLFEGYSKVLSGGVHAGYIINKYEFDNKKKQFISTSFFRTGELAGNFSESLKAIATEDLKPISYQYTFLLGKKVKTIDAKVEKGKLIASVNDGGKTEKIIRDLPKGAFFSTFLTYVMLKSPQGLTLDTKYDYDAIAEEDAELYKGIAFVKNEEKFGELKAIKVLNEFKSNKFISLINKKGEVFSTRSPAQSISTELVASSAQAVGNFQVPNSTLKALFGEVPVGTKNEISEVNSGKVPGKQFGTPPGKGILLKGGATPPASTEEVKKGP